MWERTKSRSAFLSRWLQPVMQMEIKLRLRAADGAEIQTTIGNTINKVP